MIDFACKRFEIEEIIRCGFGLSKADYNILVTLMRRGSGLTTKELAHELKLDLSTTQRSVKKLFEKDIISRSQFNLPSGYLYKYSIKDKDAIKDKIMVIIRGWVSGVETSVRNW
ncbi:MarR family transcriptional regulator [Candidatus Pacearchaeota archaeon]|nr:MarR family transcriptional regulator [Candidatus Pacearchaeota archaeon]